MSEFDRSNMQCRLRTQRVLVALGLTEDLDQYALLSKLLGLPHDTIMTDMTEKHRDVCRMIMGPHGRTIIKVLLARATDEQLPEA